MPRSWPTTIPLVTISTCAAPVGQQLGDAGGLVEAQLVDHDYLPGGLGSAFEHVANVHHARMIAGPPRPGRIAPVASMTTSGESACSDRPWPRRPCWISTPGR